MVRNLCVTTAEKNWPKPARTIWSCGARTEKERKLPSNGFLEMDGCAKKNDRVHVHQEIQKLEEAMKRRRHTRVLTSVFDHDLTTSFFFTLDH